MTVFVTVFLMIVVFVSGMIVGYLYCKVCHQDAIDELIEEVERWMDNDPRRD